MTTSGKHFPASHASDAVTVSPGVIPRVVVDKAGAVTKLTTPVVALTVNQTKPERVALASLTAAEARDVAAELLAQADALDPPLAKTKRDAPTLPSLEAPKPPKPHDGEP